MTEQKTIDNMYMEQIENDCFVDLSEKLELPSNSIKFRYAYIQYKRRG